MKLIKKVAIEFFEKIMLDEEEQIKEMVLDFSADGVKVIALTPSNVAFVSASLKSEAVIEYQALGKIGITNVPEIVKILRSFTDEEITMTLAGNVMMLSQANKQVDIELAEISFIKTPEKIPSVEYTETVTIPAAQLHAIFKDSSINKDAALEIMTEAGKTIIRSAGRYKFTYNIDTPSAIGGIHAKFGTPLINAVSALTGDLKLSLKSDYPMRIEQVNDKENITIVVAPRMPDQA